MQEALAQLVAASRASDLSVEDRQTASNFLLDCLAIGIAGYGAPFRMELMKVVNAWGGGGRCGILGDQVCVPPATAAFMNTFQMHCLEFDCVHEAAVAHVMTAPVAVALAECAQSHQPVSGATLLTALTVGVEVAATLGLAARSPLFFFRPATSGVFGAAATVASLRGFDSDRVLNAFGHALCQAAGTMQAHEEGKPTLAIQLAGAARAGLTAADLAESGIPAPVRSIDGDYGYLALFETETSTERLMGRAGKPWRVRELSYKPWPSGRATHGGIELVLQLRQRGLRAEHVQRLVLTAPPLIHQLVIRPATRDMNANYARLCFPYVGAVALRNGAVGLGDFARDLLTNDEVLSLAALFHAEVAALDDPAAFTPQQLRAELKDGSVLETELEVLPGVPENPLSDTQRFAKVRHCVGDGAAQLIGSVSGLAGLADVRETLSRITGAG